MLAKTEKFRIRDILFSLLIAKLALVLVYSASKYAVQDAPYAFHEFIGAAAEVFVFVGLLASVTEARQMIFFDFIQPRPNSGSLIIVLLIVIVPVFAVISRFFSEWFLVFFTSLFQGWELAVRPTPLTGFDEKVFGVLITAPINEEIIYRGMVLRLLMKRISSFTSVILSSLIFAVIHRDFILPFLAGIYISIVYISTKRLSLAMVAHSSMNAYALLLWENFSPVAIWEHVKHDYCLVAGITFVGLLWSGVTLWLVISKGSKFQLAS